MKPNFRRASRLALIFAMDAAIAAVAVGGLALRLCGGPRLGDSLELDVAPPDGFIDMCWGIVAGKPIFRPAGNRHGFLAWTNLRRLCLDSCQEPRGKTRHDMARGRTSASRTSGASAPRLPAAGTARCFANRWGNWPAETTPFLPATAISTDTRPTDS